MTFEEWWEKTLIGGSDYDKAKAVWDAAVEQTEKKCEYLYEKGFSVGFGEAKRKYDT
jgi:hypothetical protein